MEMQFFWIWDKIAQEMYTLKWHPGQENLANYQSKHHDGSNHVAVRPWYLHSKVPLGYYQGRRDLAHWKGVLEPLKIGTYVKHPYRGLKGSISLDTLVMRHMIPIT